MRFFNSSPLKKWPLFRRRIFSVAFSWMKSFVFLLKCHWRLFLRVQLTITQPWFRKWLGAEYATSHYLKHCWPDCLMHICGTRGRWEFKVTLLSISSCGLWWPDDVMQNGRRNLAIFVTLQRWNLFQYRLWLINMFDYVGTKIFYWLELLLYLLLSNSKMPETISNLKSRSIYLFNFQIEFVNLSH